MSRHESPNRFSGSKPVISRCKRYETKKERFRPRSAITQVRDWLHSAGLTEIWIDHGVSTVWSVNGRPAMSLSTPDGKSCQIQLKGWMSAEVGSSGLLDRVSHTLLIKSGADLHLVKPFIRLGLAQSYGRRRADENLIFCRMISTDQMKHLQRKFVSGLYPCEEVIFGKGERSCSTF